MEEKPQGSESRDIVLGSKKLRIYFINNLDKIYSAKMHLIKHLPEIAKEAFFKDLRFAILETVEDVERQLTKLDIIYAILDVEMGKGKCSALAGLVNDAFEDIKLNNNDPELRDLYIAYYLQNIESMEMASFQVLEMAAVKLKIKQIQELIKENYDEAKADRSLLLLITAKYITS